MADQRIFFEQGSVDTGDSGERGDAAAGVDSIKPYDSGERASEAVFNRPIENTRRRTEVLRNAGEEAKYLLDSNVRWLISAGGADGLATGLPPIPSISSWDKTGGTFATTSAIVVQPINTPGSDVQETATYTFVDTLAQTASLAFTPLSRDPADYSPATAYPQKRAYNGANLIEIIWEAVPEASLASALVPGYCDISLTGDPEHIIIISIRNDSTTQMSNIITALGLLATGTGELGTIGLGYVVSGTVATSLDIADVSGDPKGLAYRMSGTFEREIHYIPPASFAGFFAIPNTLEDGDTLSVYCAEYTSDNAVLDALTGRRESVPSNNTSGHSGTTTVAASDLFITSSGDDVYKIPLAVPLCKRIGDDLYWMDGTVVQGNQVTFPVFFGEHGVTVDRSIPGVDILAADSNVTGHWLFNDRLSVGTVRSSTTEYSVLITSTVSTLAGLKVDTTGAAYGTQIVASGGTAGLALETTGADYGTQIVASGGTAGLALETTGADYGTHIVVSGGTTGLLVDTTGADYGMQIAASGGVAGLELETIGANFGVFITVDTTANAGIYIDATDATYGMQIGSSASPGSTTTYSYGIRLEHSASSTAIVSGELSGASISLLNQGAPAVKPGSSHGLKVRAIHDPSADGIVGEYTGVTVDASGVLSGLAVIADASGRGLKVATTGTSYGAAIGAENANTTLVVTATGTTGYGINISTTTATTPLCVGAGAATASSVIDRSLVVGNNGPPDTSEGFVALNIMGAFKTDIDIVSSDPGTTLDATNLSIIRITAGGAATIETITGGVHGQWLCVLNTQSSNLDITFNGNAGGSNLQVGGTSGQSVVKNTEAILFIYVNAKWREIAHA